MGNRYNLITTANSVLTIFIDKIIKNIENNLNRNSSLNIKLFIRLHKCDNNIPNNNGPANPKFKIDSKIPEKAKPPPL